MRIISSFHDYYDPVMRHGMDREYVYVRETTEIAPKVERPCWRSWAYRESVIGFCGELFPVLLARARDTDHFQHFYGAQEALEFAAKAKLAYDGRRRRDHDWLIAGSLDRFFGQEGQPVELRALFVRHRVPFFVQALRREGWWLGGGHWTTEGQVLTLNPRLADYEFQRVKDPFTAFQEIHGYLSGVLGVTHRPPEEPVPDVIKAASRGHGDRYSFRKPPGKRGEPKWR